MLPRKFPESESLKMSRNFCGSSDFDILSTKGHDELEGGTEEKLEEESSKATEKVTGVDEEALSSPESLFPRAYRDLSPQVSDRIKENA